MLLGLSKSVGNMSRNGVGTRISLQPQSKTKMAALWGRKVCFQDTDEELIKRFQERRTAGICVTGKGVKYEPLQLHKQHGNQNFRASNGWYLKFVKWHNISSQQSIMLLSTQKNWQMTGWSNFWSISWECAIWQQYDGEYGWNMSLVGTAMEEYPFTSQGAWNNRIINRAWKKRITVKLAAYSDGTKLLPLILLPGIRPMKKDEIPSSIQVYCGSGRKSSADEDSIKHWLRVIWGQNNQTCHLLV